VEGSKVARKAKRTLSSLSYPVQKFYRRISTTKPSTVVLAAISIALTIFLFGGGLYDMIMKPLPSVYYGGRFLSLYPRLSEQFIAGSITAMILYSFGIIGLIVMYQSTKYAYKPRQAYMMFLVGVVLLLVSYVFFEYTIRIKMGG
jgi:hypothetical protein